MPHVFLHVRSINFCPYSTNIHPLHDRTTDHSLFYPSMKLHTMLELQVKLELLVSTTNLRENLRFSRQIHRDRLPIHTKSEFAR